MSRPAAAGRRLLVLLGLRRGEDSVALTDLAPWKLLLFAAIIGLIFGLMGRYLF
ncbi:MAG: hypothetical protein JWN95_2020 [Frankiales bacterium]|nr:hypothetical protein [Frankiales bacterium]